MVNTKSDPRTTVPATCITRAENVVKRCHRDVGHQSVEKTLQRAREIYTADGKV